MAYKDHIMSKGKSKVMTKNKKAHESLKKDGWGHPRAKNGMKYKHGGKSLRRPQHD